MRNKNKNLLLLQQERLILSQNLKLDKKFHVESSYFSSMNKTHSLLYHLPGINPIKDQCINEQYKINEKKNKTKSISWEYGNKNSDGIINIKLIRNLPKIKINNEQPELKKENDRRRSKSDFLTLKKYDEIPKLLIDDENLHSNKIKNNSLSFSKTLVTTFKNFYNNENESVFKKIDEMQENCMEISKRARTISNNIENIISFNQINEGLDNFKDKLINSLHYLKKMKRDDFEEKKQNFLKKNEEILFREKFIKSKYCKILPKKKFDYSILTEKTVELGKKFKKNIFLIIHKLKSMKLTYNEVILF